MPKWIFTSLLAIFILFALGTLILTGAGVYGITKGVIGHGILLTLAGVWGTAAWLFNIRGIIKENRYEKNRLKKQD